MKLNGKRFRRILLTLLLVDAVACGAFIIFRAPLREDGWAFLEKQRPRVTETASGVEMSFTMVADGLNFAIFRRPIAGWESLTIRAFELYNVAPFLGAVASFETLQTSSFGHSKLNSDIATGVFCLLALVQFGLIALVASFAGDRRVAAV